MRSCGVWLVEHAGRSGGGVIVKLVGVVLGNYRKWKLDGLYINLC